MPMQVILLERVENLGNLGEVVNVKPGFARNFLIPQNKALRATKDNVAYFEAQKKEIEKKNEANRKEAEKRAKKLEGLSVNIIRHAAEGGQLYGSVTARDIAESVTEQCGEKIGRSMVTLNHAFKTIGLFPVDVALHPEVKVEVTINVARSEDEAKIQAKTGKALIADEEESASEVIAEAEAELEEKAEAAKEELLEESALEAEKEAAEEEARQQAEEEAQKAREEEEAKAAEAEAESDEETAETEADAASEETEDEKKD